MNLFLNLDLALICILFMKGELFTLISLSFIGACSSMLSQSRQILYRYL